MKWDRTPELGFYEWSITRWLSSATRTRLDATGRGIFREILDMAYAQGSIPADHDVMARYCGASLEEFERVWAVIKRHFVRSKRDHDSLEHKQASVFRRSYFTYVEEQRTKGRNGGRPKGRRINKKESTGLPDPKPTGLGDENPRVKPEESQQTNEQTNEQTNITDIRTMPNVREWPETADAIRGFFPATDDPFVTEVVHLSAQAYADAISGCSEAPEFSDWIVAEAVRRAHFKDQESAGWFKTGVPRCVKTWAEQAIRQGSIR